MKYKCELFHHFIAFEQKSKYNFISIISVIYQYLNFGIVYSGKFIVKWEILFWLDTLIKIYVRVLRFNLSKMDYWTDEAHKEWEYHQWFTFLLPKSSIMIGRIDFRLFSSSWQNATKHKIIFSFYIAYFLWTYEAITYQTIIDDDYGYYYNFISLLTIITHRR